MIEIYDIDVEITQKEEAETYKILNDLMLRKGGLAPEFGQSLQCLLKGTNIQFTSQRKMVHLVCQVQAFQLERGINRHEDMVALCPDTFGR